MGSKVVRVGDIATINSSQYSPKEKWSHIQYLDTGSVTKGSISDLQQLDPAVDKIPSRARRKVFDKSIVYSMVRPNQEHYAFLDNPPTDMLVSTGFSVIDAKTELVSPGYLYYSLTTAEATEHFQSLAEQCVSTYPTLGVGDLSAYEIVLPSLDIQRAIERILGDLDDKIKLNSQLNDYLAELLDAQYGRLIAESSESALLIDIVRILSGGTPKTKNSEYWEGGSIPFFAPGDVTNSIYTLVTEKHITESGLNNCNSALYPVDTVFLTARGTVGKVAMAGRPMAMNQSCFAFAGIKVPQTVVFQVIKGAVRSLKAKANGATFAAINTRDLKDEEVSILSSERMAIYDRWAKPLHEMVRSNEEESLRLAALRDALLPKLMSGEIDVSKVDIAQLNNHLA